MCSIIFLLGTFDRWLMWYPGQKNSRALERLCQFTLRNTEGYDETMKRRNSKIASKWHQWRKRKLSPLASLQVLLQTHRVPAVTAAQFCGNGRWFSKPTSENSGDYLQRAIEFGASKTKQFDFFDNAAMSMSVINRATSLFPVRNEKVTKRSYWVHYKIGKRRSWKPKNYGYDEAD